MNDWLASLGIIEGRLSERKGNFALFAAFLPAEAADQWDLIVSASWARRDDRAVLDLLSNEIATYIRPIDRLLLARIVVVEPWHLDVQEINARVEVEHALVPVHNEEHFGYAVERGFIITSKDYWAFIKRLFPQSTEFVFFMRDGDLFIRVSWYLHDDPRRPHKKSRNIVLAISQEALDDYLWVDDPRRHEAENRLAAYVADRLTKFNPHHDSPPNRTPPREEWRVTTSLFRPEASALG